MASPAHSGDRLRQRSATIFFLIVIGYLAIGSVKLILENYRIHQDSSRLDADIVRLKQNNLELKNLLAYYRTDSYKEKEARARLNFQKPGERVVPVAVPPGDDESSITQPGIETQAPTPPSNPQQWHDYFFGKRA